MQPHLSHNFLFYAVYTVLAVCFFFFSSPLLGDKRLRRRLKVNVNAYVVASVQLWFWLALAIAYHMSDLYLPAQSPLAVFVNLPTLPLSLFFPLWLLTSAVLLLFDLVIATLRKLFAWRVMFARDLTEALETGAIIAGFISILYAQCDPRSSLAFSWHSFELRADHESVICQWLQSGTAAYRERHHPLVVIWCTAVSLSFVNFVFESFERFAGVRGVFSARTSASTAVALQRDVDEEIVDNPGEEMVNWCD